MKIKIQGVPPFDGEYEYNAATLTNRELHTIKEISGVRAGELEEAMGAGDNDVLVAFAVIAVRRAGLVATADHFWDSDVGSLDVILTDAEKEAAVRPPAQPSPTGNENSLDDDDGKNESTTRSGEPLSNGSDQLPSVQSRTGQLGSEPSAASVLGMFAS